MGQHSMIEQERLKGFYQEGYKAYGKTTLEDCPYTWSEEFEWKRGWKQANYDRKMEK